MLGNIEFTPEFLNNCFYLQLGKCDAIFLIVNLFILIIKIKLQSKKNMCGTRDCRGKAIA